jgi:phage portal protein BeeE
MLPASWFNRVFDLPQSASIREPFKNSVWVARAIKKIAGPVSAVPVEVYRAEGMDTLRAKLLSQGWPGSERTSRVRAERKFRRSPRLVIQLARRAGYTKSGQAEEYINPGLSGWLREPSPRLAWSDFIEAVIGWLKLRGETFWLHMDKALPFPEAANGWPKIIVARPDRMREDIDGDELTGWEWTDRSGKVWPLLDDQVIQTKYWNPYNDWRGLGEWEAAQIAADSDYLAGKFKRDLMANNGDTGAIIGLKDGGSLTDDQMKQVREQIREKRRLQQQGIYVPIFLPGNISVEDPKIRAVDTAYVAVRLEDRHEVFIAFGVPPSMGDVKAAYSIGMQSDYYQLITDTCIPTGTKVTDGLQRLFKRQTGLELEVYLDWDEHIVMQQVRRERIETIDKLWSKGMPMEEISEYLDLDLPEFEGWDEGYLPFNVSPVVNGAEMPEKEPGLAEPDFNLGPTEQTPTPAQEAIWALRSRLSGREPLWAGPRRAFHNPQAAICCCGCSLEEAMMSTKTLSARQLAQWKSIVAPRMSTIKAFRSKFDRVLMEARRHVMAKLEKAGAKSIAHSQPPTAKGMAADFLFNLLDFRNALSVGMRAIATTAVADAGEQVFKELNRNDPWKSPSQATLEFLKTRENKLSNVPDEVFGRVKGVIQEGMDAGDPMADIAKAVAGEFNEISDGRGKVIAQTETAAAFGFGRHEAMKAAGVQWKRWLTSGNGTVRWAHELMNDTIIAIGEEFVVTNQDGDVDQVMHPADSAGEPWNVINCHCVEVASADGPEGKAE